MLKDVAGGRLRHLLYAPVTEERVLETVTISGTR